MFGKGTFDSSEPKSSGTFRPQLTSLVDVMTILLVFLIKSFSVEGNLVTPSSDLKLPISTSEKPPKPVFGIEITRSAVLTEEGQVATLEEIKESDSLLIPVLYDLLLLEKNKDTESTKSKDVMIQSDREVEFDIVKRVMFTCSKAGFSDFSVLVLEDE